jgi:quinol---cytochrome c reductase cytochrome b subunit, bacillus type
MTRKPPGQDWLPIRLVKESNFWRSLIRQPYPTTSRTRALAVMNNVFLHLHPVRVKRHAVRYTYTFCLGGVSFFLFLVLTVTGLYLMFFYIPSVDRAYQDIIAIENSVAFGSLVRNMHRWGAHLMVLTVFLHMMRVFYHGAYKPPREWNWAVGTFLLFCTLWLSFTGYLLPWDQIAFWAVTVGTQMAAYAPLIPVESNLILLGAVEVGQETLIRFYVFHVIAFPLITAIFMVIHFWRIRKDGGISGPV